MSITETMGAIVFFLSIIVLWRKSTYASLFAFAYLLTCHGGDSLLEYLGLENISIVAFISLLTDFLFIMIITYTQIRSKIVLPVLFTSMAYGVACLVEQRLDMTQYLMLSYGWVNALLGAAVLAGGYFDDPGGDRTFNIRNFFHRIRARFLPDSAVVESKTK